MRTLTEKAYQCIKEGIVRGEIKEGVFLSEKDIMKRYRIGRTPFREACNRLHHEQLLEVVPRRGYLVPQMSLQEVRDLFEVRMLVEGEELTMLADQSLPSNRTRKGANDRAELNANFHLLLAAMAHNHELMRLERSVLERTRRLAYNVAHSIGVEEEEMSLQTLHRPIVDAIQRRDRAAARRAVIHDIHQAQTILVGLADRKGGVLDGSARSQEASSHPLSSS
jgi:DNA-binding GntR family transcriptional regulator